MSVFRAVAWDRRRHAHRQRGPAPALVDRDRRRVRRRSLRSSRRGVPRHPHARRLDCASSRGIRRQSTGRRGSRRSSASMSPTRRRSQPSPARWKRSARWRRRASPRRACRIQVARSLTPISTRSASAGRWRSRSVSTMCPPASRIRRPIGKRPAASRLPPAAIVAVEDSGAGARSARAAGLYVIGYAPDGNALVGSNRTITQLTDILARKLIVKPGVLLLRRDPPRLHRTRR